MQPLWSSELHGRLRVSGVCLGRGRGVHRQVPGEDKAAHGSSDSGTGQVLSGAT